MCYNQLKRKLVLFFNRLKLSWTLFVFFGLLILFIVTSLLVIIVRQSKITALKNSENYKELAFESAVKEVNNLFNPIKSELGIARDLVKSGILSSEKIEDNIPVFLPRLETLENCFSMNIADNYGNVVTIFRDLDTTQNKGTQPSKWTVRHYQPSFDPLNYHNNAHWYRFNVNVDSIIEFWNEDLYWSDFYLAQLYPDKNRDELTETQKFYDPRKRDWHKGAVELLKQKEVYTDFNEFIFFTDIDIFFTTKELGVTGSIAAQCSQGEFVVIAYDLLLKNISEYTMRIKPSESGYVWIFNSKGNIIGLPSERKFLSENKINDFVNKHYSELKIPELDYVMDKWFKDEIKIDETQKIEYKGKEMRVKFMPLSFFNNDTLYIGFLVPDKDLMQSYFAKRNSMIIVGILALLFTLVFTYCISRRISKPIELLKKAADSFSISYLNSSLPINSAFEIVSLSHSFEQMYNQLQSQLKQLSKNEENIRALVSNLPGIVYKKKYGVTNELIYVSDQVFEVVNHKTEDFINKTVKWIDFVHPEDRDNYIFNFNEKLSNLQKFELEYRILLPDGTIKWMLESSKIVNHQEFIVEGYIQDITNKKLADIALIELEHYRNEMFETSRVPIVVMDTEDKSFIDGNPAAVKVYGCNSKAELIGKKPLDFTFNKEVNREEILKRVDEKVNMAINENFVVFNWKNIRSNGEIWDAEVHLLKFTISNKLLLQFSIFDITERNIFIDQIRKFSRVVDQNPLGIIITKINHSIEYVNPKLLQITGYPLDFFIGQKPEVLKNLIEIKNLFEIIRSTILNGDEWSGEVRAKNKDGNTFWASLRVYPLRSENSEITHLILTCEDISSKVEVKEQLIKAKEKAEESEKLKSAFLANMSHEIRTPMNGILGFLALLKNMNLSEDQKARYIDIVNVSGNRLLETVNNIIEMSRIESGEITVYKSIFSVNEILSYLFNFFSLQAKEKKLELKVNYLETDIKNLYTDRHLLEGVLINLIKNAIKFTKQGSVDFGCEIEDNLLKFYVKDTGQGIAEDRIQAIFERFVQADLKYSRGYEGSGLGLTIAKSFVEILGGNIKVESIIEKGSCFYFNIPIIVKENDEVDEINLSEDYYQAKMLNLSGTTILIAEDDETSYVYLDTILSSYKIKTLWAKTGEEALKLFSENADIKLVILDIKMPKVDGFDVCREIKRKSFKTLIIAQSAFAFPDEKNKALKVGFDDYLIKPISRFELLRSLSKTNMLN